MLVEIGVIFEDSSRKAYVGGKADKQSKEAKASWTAFLRHLKERGPGSAAVR